MILPKYFILWYSSHPPSGSPCSPHNTQTVSMNPPPTSWQVLRQSKLVYINKEAISTWSTPPMVGTWAPPLTPGTIVSTRLGIGFHNLLFHMTTTIYLWWLDRYRSPKPRCRWHMIHTTWYQHWTSSWWSSWSWWLRHYVNWSTSDSVSWRYRRRPPNRWSTYHSMIPGSLFSI